ncbi:MAG: LamB/YcsF family protein [Bacteroidetes bacterium]|nr:MAG: LamB/YcsF family protein [Bacteroidota bacterium]
MLFIDINCDMGESYGAFRVGNDEAIMPFITSASIACGFHGGDPVHIEKTIRMALERGVRIGAHPSYPDLQGFGRRPMNLSAGDLRAFLRYQIAALKGMTESLGGQLAYVKPHGALYNAAATDPQTARVVAETVRDMGGGLSLMGLAGSVVAGVAAETDVPFIGEAFADRRYEASGQLRSRALPDAVISEPEQAAGQVLSCVQKHKVVSYAGTEISVNAQSMCIHGDNPAAVEILKSIDRALALHGIQKKAMA